MARQIFVYVNDEPVTVYEGMHVKHALISCDISLYEAAKNEEIIIEDKNGFEIGLDGALNEGERIYTRPNILA
ncbi:MAG: hypothetical protein JXC33_05295 [Deltaproteobacteria bacterium]|nr:hypothetical protein [Deltaproteobacteria bacterium]